MKQNGDGLFQSPVIRIVNTALANLPELAYFQRRLYPMLTESERYTLTKYHHHLTLFPEGQFVAIASVNREEKLVDATSTFAIV